MKLLVTGASGFVGRPLCRALSNRGYQVGAAMRTRGQLSSAGETVTVGEIDADTKWADALHGVDTVIHLAARVHVMKDRSADSLTEFLNVNLYGTSNLAQQAASAGVRRFVYVSSIKVNGEETSGERIYSEQDIPAPQDPYSVSKWEAEQAMHRVARETGLEIVIVRPSLVYGEGVKGNFAQMMQVLVRGVPLPLASVCNKRDLIYVGNLVDALIACATHPAAAGQTYLLSDGEPVSTPELLRRLAKVTGVSSHLFPFPPAFLHLAGKLFGRSAQVERLLGSLQVDSGKIRRELNWTPPYTLQQGLQATAEWYRNTHL